MAKANVAHSPAPVGSPDDLEAIFQGLMGCDSLISPEVETGLRDLSESAEMTVRPWLFTAYVASQGGEFFAEISEDADKARLMASMSKVLEEFAERMKLVADLAEKSALRIRLAGCNHPDFDTWRDEDPNADTDGGAAHV